MRILRSQKPDIPIPSCSIFTYLHSQDRHDPNKLAFADATTGTQITRRQFKELALSFAHGVRNELVKLGGPQIKRGDTVLVFSPNSLAFPVVVHGLLAAGLRATLANSSYTPTELAHQLKDSGAKAMLVHPAFLKGALECGQIVGWNEAERKSRIIVMAWDVKDKGPDLGLVQMEQLLGKGSLQVEEKFDGKLCEETALLCYSSGTTGKPKGVETMHKNLVAQVCLLPHYFKTYPNDVFVGVLPFYHIYGALNFLFYGFQEGVPIAILPRFEPDLFCKTIQDYKVTVAMIVPPILVVLARHPVTEKYNLKTMRQFTSGAAPLGGPLVKAVVKRLQSVGCKAVIVQGYGLTETSPASHLLDGKDAMRKLGSVGQLFRNTEARLVTDKGEDARDGEPGELWVRGPIVMKGYLNNVEATRNAITPDGFFKTGDIAIVDKEGYYYIVDRAKELIKYKGFQVPPAELESVLLQHPLIADAGVVGVENVDEATEVPRAYVVHAKGLASDKDKAAFSKEVQKWIQKRVAKHKFLRGGVVVIDAVPKSPAGKILRRELRDRARKEYAEETRTVRSKL